MAASLAALLAAVPAMEATAQEGLPDPDYCARRDADPQKCFIADAPVATRALETVETRESPLPDPAYCSQRDADPRKCVVQDGPPRPPIVRARPPAAFVIPPPPMPAPTP